MEALFRVWNGLVQLVEFYGYFTIARFRCYFTLKIKGKQQAKSQRSFENLNANVYEINPLNK